MRSNRFLEVILFIVVLSLIVGCSQKSVYFPFEEILANVENNIGVQLPHVDETALDFLLYLPEEYDPDSDQEWPLMVYLHGRGERGDDLELLKLHGPPKLLSERNHYPFIIVSPQCPLPRFWDSHISQVRDLLDYLLTQYHIDANRIIITGTSMGGYATWDFATQYPDLPAAIVPMASFYLPSSVPENICDIKDIPVWAFQGGRDEYFTPEESIQPILDALENCGAQNVQYTLYPEADHWGTWQRAYADPELYVWMLAQKK